ncbi:DUF3515 family protein [Nostocoides vanveenii]|uniref:DUF3515 domain-containing protein n=1 Tax=Nostocoides vanveenii TaxID=330835 RepID=A0ABN2KSI3_9MICO
MASPLTACGNGSVGLAVPSHAGAAACARMPWPTALGELTARSTDPADPAVAAWGDPAVIARCGLTPPGPTTDPCITVDGTDWIIRELSDGAAFTTFGTDPAVEVLIPRAYAPEPMLLTDFDAAVATLPTTGRRCVGKSAG